MVPSVTGFRSLGFNFDLFIIDGKPLEFYLDGFEHVESSKIAAVVEAFGGKFSGPRSLQTVVFVNPNHISQWSHDCYDIKFLEDSVVAQKLQNLEDYRIPCVNLTPKSPVVEQKSSSIEVESKFGNLYNNVQESCLAKNNDENEMRKSNDLNDQVMPEKIEEVSVNSSVARVEIHQNPEPLSEETKHAEDNSEDQLRTEASRDDGGQKEGSLQDQRMFIASRIYSYRPEDRDPHLRRKEVELGCSSSSSSSSETIWNDDFEQPKAKKTTRKKRSCNIYHKYTEEEHNRIFQYLIDKKAILRIPKKEMWNEMLAAEILAAPRPTANALHQHFRLHLLRNYRKYTDDPLVLAEFQKINEKYKKHSGASVNNRELVHNQFFD